MRNDIDAEEVAALQSGRVVERRLLWATLRDRDTGDPVSFGFWNGMDAKAMSVVDGLSGAIVSRTFQPGLVAVGPLRLEIGLNVREADAVFAANDENAELAFRGYSAKRAPVQVYRGLFDPATFSLVKPAKTRFVGFIDRVDFQTAAEAGESGIEAHLVANTLELTRTNTAVRSFEDQRLRNPADDFYKFTGVAADWPIFWGRAK